MNSRYVADLFAGEGGVSQQVRLLGFKARTWEIKHGAEFDLCRQSEQQNLIKEIKSGKVIACMLAPPCTTFSAARDRTHAIRNRTHPWGIPNLSERDQLKIKEGNANMRANIRFLRACLRAGVPAIMENPATSK